MAASSVLKLGFTTGDSKVVSVNVTDPAENLNDEAIQDAMDEMIASGVVTKMKGVIQTRKYAKLVTTDITDIALP